MKKTILIAVTCVLGTLVNAQSLSPVAIGSGFVNGSSSNAEISSTVGQTAFGVKEDGTSQITEGVHQPKVDIVNIEDNAPEIEMKVYPNPNSGQFSVNFIENRYEGLRGELVDINGVSVQKFKLPNQNKSVDISNYPNGIYYLQVYDSKGTMIKRYKVVRVN